MKGFIRIAAAAAALGVCISVPAAESDLLISEVLEGNSGSLKYVEIINRGATTVDLTASAVTLRRYSNGSSSVTASIPLVGTIAAGGRFVIANNQTDLDTFMGGYVPSQISTNVSHNGDDGYDLVYGAGPTVIDTFAKDLMVGITPGNFCNDLFSFRVLSALPNNGAWGATGRPADGANSPSGYWKVVYLTAANGNALAIGTPGTGGGGGGVEVPVTLSQMTIE